MDFLYLALLAMLAASSWGFLHLCSHLADRK
jgi:hypothetical protein